MKYILTIILSVLILSLSACVDDNTLTAEQIKIQQKATDVVAQVLFEYEIDTRASYNVRKNGFVVIKFNKDIPFDVYNAAVADLRASRHITGVDAWQGGRNVCVLSQIQNQQKN